MYRPKWSLHVLSAFGSMVSPVASLLSVKRVSLSLLLQSNHFRNKLFSNTSWFSTPLPSSLHNSVLQLVTTAGTLLLYFASPESLTTKKLHIPNPPSLCLQLHE